MGFFQLSWNCRFSLRELRAGESKKKEATVAYYQCVTIQFYLTLLHKRGMASWRPLTKLCVNQSPLAVRQQGGLTSAPGAASKHSSAEKIESHSGLLWWTSNAIFQLASMLTISSHPTTTSNAPTVNYQLNLQLPSALQCFIMSFSSWFCCLTATYCFVHSHRSHSVDMHATGSWF